MLSLSDVSYPSPSRAGVSPICHPTGPPQSLKARKNTTKITRFGSAVSFIGKEGNSKTAKITTTTTTTTAALTNPTTTISRMATITKKKNNNRKSGGRDGFASWISAFSTSSWIEFPIL